MQMLIPMYQSRCNANANASFSQLTLHKPNSGSLEIITSGLWLSPAVSTRDPIIKPEGVSSRAANGRGLILRAMTKVPCYNLFITYSKLFFRIILIKNTKKILIFIPK